MQKLFSRKERMTLKEQKHIKERIAVFFDVQNLYKITLLAYPNHRINYKNIMMYLMKSKPYNGIPRELITAYAYTVCNEGHNQTGFVEYLKNADIQVKEKIRKEHIKETGSDFSKTDWDVGMCVDIMDLRDKVDTVIIASNDGDFIPVLKNLKKYGIRREIFGFENFINRYLVSNVDKIHYIRDINLFKHREDK